MSYLVIYQICLDRNRAFFFSEKEAKQFVEAIKPIAKSLTVFNVDIYANNFYKEI